VIFNKVVKDISRFPECPRTSKSDSIWPSKSSFYGDIVQPSGTTSRMAPLVLSMAPFHMRNSPNRTKKQANGAILVPNGAITFLHHQTRAHKCRQPWNFHNHHDDRTQSSSIWHHASHLLSISMLSFPQYTCSLSSHAAPRPTQEINTIEPTLTQNSPSTIQSQELGANPYTLSTQLTPHASSFLYHPHNTPKHKNHISNTFISVLKKIKHSFDTPLYNFLAPN